ncbi:hypothetical protein HMPREF3037_01683 [Candidatus Stoquefichus sp. KLE1796]|nr:hypothetical protein HMPREF3037_01683 [Candidatus Stoquefichus sp. KLE1796]
MHVRGENMELIINPSRTKKIKLQFVIYITLISFLVSLVSIHHTSLLFVYLCFIYVLCVDIERY